MKKTGYNQFEIIVQKNSETGLEFAERLNKWSKNHTNMPMLINATATNDGRQTLNFSCYIAISYNHNRIF